MPPVPFSSMEICSFLDHRLASVCVFPKSTQGTLPTVATLSPKNSSPLTPRKSLSVKKANADKQSSSLNQLIPELPPALRTCSQKAACMLRVSVTRGRHSRLKRQHAHPRNNLLTIMLLGRHHNLYLYLHMPAVNMK